MFTIDIFTSEDNPHPPLAGAVETAESPETAQITETSETTGRRQPRRPAFDTWTLLALPAPRRAGIKAALAIAAGLAKDYLTVIPRRFGDRLFAMNDTEAYWRGWQILKLRAGLARRYRDPAFDTIVAVSIFDSGDSERIDKVS